MKILIAEDDAHLLAGLKALLEREGYDCIATHDGAEALTELNDEPPDLCLFDIAMPRLNGLKLCQMTRKRHPNVPIMLLTAKDKNSDQIQGLDTGADDYVTKPFRPDMLLARIRALLRRTTPQSETINRPVQCGPFTLYPGTLKLHVGHKSLELTQKECQLMALFLANPGIAFSRDRLFNHCWHKEFLPNSRTLDQTILVLRNKLEKQLHISRVIKTVYGLGYRCDIE